MAFGILVGHALCGRWSSVDGEGVRTKFFVLFVPILPIEAFYVVGGPLRPTRTLPARWSKPSIFLAYLRWALAPIAVFATILASAIDSAGPHPFGGHHLVAMAGVVAAWAGLVFLTGRAHGRAAAQRRLMKRYLGHAAAPELLADEAIKSELGRLEEIWKAASSKESPYIEGDAKRPWREAYPKEIRNSLVALYYALCRYDAALSRDEIRQNRARLAWDRIEGLA
jgi:hypothetical protein